MFRPLRSLNHLLQLTKRPKLPLLYFVRHKPFPMRRRARYARTHPITESYSLSKYASPKLSLSQAVDALRAYSLVDIDEHINLRFHLDFFNSKRKKQIVQLFNTVVVFPHQLAEDAKVFVICNPDEIASVKQCGAKGYLDHRSLDELENEMIDEYDFFIVTEVAFDFIRPLGRLLKGKMPNRRKGSVVSVDQLSTVVKRFHGTTSLKCDRFREDHTQGFLDISFGKLSFSKEKLLENLDVILDKICEYNVPEAKKFITLAKLSTEYGPTFVLSEDLYLRVNDTSADSSGLF